MNKILLLAAGSLLLCQIEGAAFDRAPQAAGLFYPNDPVKTKALVKKYLLAGKPLPGNEPVALLVPHSGLEFTGALAGKAYSLMRGTQWEAVLFVAAAHYSELDGAIIYPGRFKIHGTVLPYDKSLAEDLVKASPLIRFDSKTHDKEHSVEVHLPFLVELGKPPVVAMLMNTQDLQTARAVGQAIASVIKGRKILIVASSDLSHYPSGDQADRIDATTLEALKQLDSAYFWLTNRLLLNRTIKELAVTYCGEGAVTAVMEAAKILGADRVEILGRLNSGDVVSERDYGHVVGYAAAAFFKGIKREGFSLGAAEKKELLSAAAKIIQNNSGAQQNENIPLSALPRLNLPASVWVTLKNKKGEYLGAGGDLSPGRSLIEAVMAATNQAVAAIKTKAVGVDEIKIEIALISKKQEMNSQKIAPQLEGLALVWKGAYTAAIFPKTSGKLLKVKEMSDDLCVKAAGLPSGCAKDLDAQLYALSAEIFTND